MKAIIVVDLQKDFSDNGKLGVQGANSIINYVNTIIKKYKDNGDLVVATKDYHPPKHISFASTHNKELFSFIDVSYGKQQLWPDHAQQGTDGSKFIDGLDFKSIEKIFYKGCNTDVDSYSAFFENDGKALKELDNYLKERKIQELLIVGLALDYCVGFTAMDATKLGYDVSIDLKGTKAINPNDIKELFKQFAKLGIKLIR